MFSNTLTTRERKSPEAKHIYWEGSKGGKYQLSRILFALSYTSQTRLSICCEALLPRVAGKVGLVLWGLLVLALFISIHPSIHPCL